MRFGRLDIQFQSLRFRLAAWNTVVVLLMIVVTLLAVREGLRLTLTRELDQLLDEDALEIQLAVEEFYPDWDLIREEINRKEIGHAHRSLFVQVLDQNGASLLASSKVPRESEMEGAEAVEGVSSDHDFRVVAKRISRPGIPPLSIRVGSSTAFVRDDLDRLSRMSVWVAIALLPLASWGGYWLAGRATKPLAEISQTAARLRPARLDERLPVHRSDDELDQLSRTINNLLDRIADYLALNREFIANAAHELRSPLAAIQSSVEVTLNADRSVAEYQELLGEIAEECGSLTTLVNQLLLLAESDAGPAQLTRGPVRLDRVVKKSLEMFHGAAEERNVLLQSTRLEPAEIHGDATRLWQVVNNLIDNALKFTPPKGRVSVEVFRDREHDRVVLRVSDTGVGIAPDNLPHVFERFYQGDKSRQRDFPARGNGLGLSICQSIVQAHGGTIAVASTPGKGTQFTVLLPATPDPAPSEADASPAALERSSQDVAV